MGNLLCAGGRPLNIQEGGYIAEILRACLERRFNKLLLDSPAPTPFKLEDLQLPTFKVLERAINVISVTIIKEERRRKGFKPEKLLQQTTSLHLLNKELLVLKDWVGSQPLRADLVAARRQTTAQLFAEALQSAAPALEGQAVRHSV